MKRLLALLLTALMLVSSAAFPATASAAENSQFLYSDDDIKDLYYDYEYVSSLVEDIFCEDTALAYWKYANNMNEKKFGSWLINASSTIMGEKPDKKYYTQLLVNMIAAFDYDAAYQVESQSQFDNLKNVKDYAFDLVDIGTTVIGLDDAAGKIGKAIEVASGTVDLLNASVEELKYYEAAIRNYANAENFLSAIETHTDNELMREAAKELRDSNELLFQTRVESIENHAENIAVFSADSFAGDFGFALMKSLDEYKTDSVVKDYVDYGEAAYQNLNKLISSGKAVFKTIMLGGDVLFGTTNTFRRHYEMLAMADIAEALVAAYRTVKVSSGEAAAHQYNKIYLGCDYLKMLISTHLRGEYLIYSLNTNDAGVLSMVSNWLEDNFREDGSTVKKWYDNQVAACEKYYAMIDGIFERLNKQKMVVHNGFELHDGFIVEIEQQTEVPSGYIGIYSYEDFKQIADSCPSTVLMTSINSNSTEQNTAKYILMNDITLPSDYDTAGAFYGVLDGNGYTMHGLNKPLFGYVGNCTVKNLGLEIHYSADLEDNNCTFGAIAELIYGWKNDKGCTFDNCFVKGNVTISCRSGEFGAIIGNGDSTVISNCYSEVDFDIKTRQSASLGGLCGKDALIANSFNTGNLNLYTSGANTFNAQSIDVIAGGIQGYNYSDSIRNCYNTGNISVSASVGCQVSSGGIVGYNYGSYNNTYFESCYNLGNISNDFIGDYDASAEYDGPFSMSFSSGGIVGLSGYHIYFNKCWNGGAVSGELFSGGIVGWVIQGSIADCYNVGAVSAVQYAGGIVGFDSSKTSVSTCYNTGSIGQGMYCGALAGTIKDGDGAMTSCYYLNNGVSATSGGINYSGAAALSSEQMADINSYAGFDFADVWKLYDGEKLPTLKR